MILFLQYNTNKEIQSHTGVAMALAFQKMLEQFWLEDKILMVNTDNEISNDTQTTKINELANSFDKENWVECNNHAMHLSAKSS